MRIIAGKYKGRRLCEFSKIGVRPTGDMARESLFNILSFGVNDSLFLDLFSGTGAIGIEALSRGAKKVVFNDQSRQSVSLIRQNLKKIGEPENACVLERDALYLLQNGGVEYDYIFSDPPYRSGLNEKVVLVASNSLKSGGTLILEDEKPFSQEIPLPLKLKDQRKYGRTYFTFIVKE